MNRLILNLIHGAMIGIVAAVVVVIVVGPSMPQNDRVFVPLDRVALPAAELACECEIGNGCKCDGCKCEEPATIQVVEKPQPPKVVSVDPITGYAATKPAVVMISRSWCGPCQAFKRGSMPGKLQAQGWAFVVNETAAATSFPTYRVFDGSRWHTVKGVLDGSRLRAILTPRYVPVVPMRERVQSQGVSWTIAGQAWTRESLIDHLATNPNHGHSRARLEAMSFGDLDRLHTSDHQSTRTTVTARQSTPLVRRGGLFARRSCASCN